MNCSFWNALRDACALCFTIAVGTACGDKFDQGTDETGSMDTNPGATTAGESRPESTTMVQQPGIQQTPEPQMDDPQTVESQTAEPQTDDPQTVESQMDEPQMDEPQMDEPQMDEPQMDEPQMDEPELASGGADQPAGGATEGLSGGESEGVGAGSAGANEPEAPEVICQEIGSGCDGYDVPISGPEACPQGYTCAEFSSCEGPFWCVLVPECEGDECAVREACNRDEDHNLRYAHRLVALCEGLTLECPENTSQFLNECGCGCQQDESCPAFVNCSPSAEGDRDPMCDDRSICPLTSRAQ